MAERIYINDDWKYADCFNDSVFDDAFAGEEVMLPHSVTETPFDYFDESIYQKITGYKKVITVPDEWKNKSVKLTFDGIAHRSLVYINGKERASHNCGYTAFSVDITEDVASCDTISVVVRVDSNEQINQPPFGFVIDYMTYGGIYRDVYLDISEKTHIEDVFLWCEKTSDGYVLKSEVEYSNNLGRKIKVSQCVNGVEETFPVSGAGHPVRGTEQISVNPGNVEPWNLEMPMLYPVITKLLEEDGTVIDQRIDSFGFRTIEFTEDGFYLNGEKVLLRGLNRHQSFAYTGYAMPASMQKLDADIMKNELGLNAVRTSHYPQSQDFVDRCDEIGLLVFTEIPGWQFIGDDEWKAQAIKNTEDMVKQYRNHPSIILWGVRINESPDDDELYKKTNEVAHKYDSTRMTGGVRNFKKSHFYEDVYTYNDFSHNGNTPGCAKKKTITSDVHKPYFISEYGGHMYPTKAFDWEEHRLEHALRHARVIDAVAGEKGIAGSFGWCLFDYNTHKDFGAGDRICYHGVLDMFRNPKLASLVYSEESDNNVVLDVSSSFDIGEHPEGCKGDIYIFSNADSVKMYKNDEFVAEFTPADSEFKNLKHGPIRINDYVGDSIVKNENYKPWMARDIKSIVNDVAVRGLSHMSKKSAFLAAKVMLFGHLKYDDAVNIFNKYVGDWGGSVKIFRFDAIKDGKVVKSVTKAPAKEVHLQVDASHTKLVHSKSYDTALVRIKAVDQYGNTVSFFNEPVELKATGNIEIIGPSLTCFRGGMTGVYVKTSPSLEKGETSVASLEIKNAQCESATVKFDVSRI